MGYNRDGCHKLRFGIGQLHAFDAGAVLNFNGSVLRQFPMLFVVGRADSLLVVEAGSGSIRLHMPQRLVAHCIGAPYLPVDGKAYSAEKVLHGLDVGYPLEIIGALGKQNMRAECLILRQQIID